LIDFSVGHELGRIFLDKMTGFFQPAKRLEEITPLGDMVRNSRNHPDDMDSFLPQRSQRYSPRKSTKVFDTDLHRLTLFFIATEHAENTGNLDTDLHGLTLLFNNKNKT